MYCLHKHNRPSLSGKIDEQFYRLEQTLEPIKTDVIRLKHDAQEDKNDINELLQDRDNTYTQMHQLEKDVERLEIHSSKVEVFRYTRARLEGEQNGLRRTCGRPELLLLNWLVEKHRL